MLVGAKVCDLTEDLLWFVCGLYVGILTSFLTHIDNIMSHMLQHYQMNMVLFQPPVVRCLPLTWTASSPTLSRPCSCSRCWRRLRSSGWWPGPLFTPRTSCPWSAHTRDSATTGQQWDLGRFSLRFKGLISKLVILS